MLSYSSSSLTFIILTDGQLALMLAAVGHQAAIALAPPPALLTGKSV